MKTKKTRTYNELMTLPTFEERYRYLKLDGGVGEDTFGFDRYMNQQFYRSREWKKVRDEVIVRDNGCDLGMPGHEITGPIYIHHMNPISEEDIIEASENLLNPKYLITVSFDTHNAIHYGNENNINKNVIVERKPNDTCPWKN